MLRVKTIITADANSCAQEAVKWVRRNGDKLKWSERNYYSAINNYGKSEYVCQIEYVLKSK